jgi:hypothetical protein
VFALFDTEDAKSWPVIPILQRAPPLAAGPV